MISTLVSSLLLGPVAPSLPVDIRAVLVELTIDADMVTRGCQAIESTGSKRIDDTACLLVAGKGVKVPVELMPKQGAPALKWKVRAAMVQYADGASQLVTPPERMMRRAFLHKYPEGQHGVILVEARDDKRGIRTCAVFAPRTVSRFEPARCDRMLSVDAMTDTTAGKRRPALIWRNAVVAAGDL